MNFENTETLLCNFRNKKVIKEIEPKTMEFIMHALVSENKFINFEINLT